MQSYSIYGDYQKYCKEKTNKSSYVPIPPFHATKINRKENKSVKAILYGNKIKRIIFDRKEITYYLCR